MRNLVNWIRHGGTLIYSNHPDDAGSRPRVLPIELEQLIWEQYAVELTLSTRVCALRLRTTHKIVWAFLRLHGWQPWKFQKVQVMTGENDFNQRLQFCINFLDLMVQRPGFERNILYSDEALFTRNGMYNQKNFVHWADINPHAIMPRDTQDRWTVNVWVGLINGQLVRLFYESVF